MTAALLLGFFGKNRILYPSKKLMSNIVEICAAVGIAGGSTYDALIGSIASDHDATLLTLDRRALRTYERLGIGVELLSN